MKQTNCPNCGAPIMSDKCPYCGTMFYDFAALDADEPFYLKIKSKGKVYITKVIMKSAEWCPDYGDLGCSRIDSQFLIIRQAEHKLDISFRVLGGGPEYE